MVNVRQLYKFFDDKMPFATQEEWDNSGIIIDAGVETDKILCCLDVTNDVLERAIREKCGIIISHHPVIYSKINKLYHDNIVFKVVNHGISVISVHTNFDKYTEGTCYNLAKYCGIDGDIEQRQLGIVVKINKFTCVDEVIQNVKKKTQAKFTVSKSYREISRIFIIAGSARGMVEEILSCGCDCVITGEMGYHDILDLKEKGVSCICFGHDESEKISVYKFAELINNHFSNVRAITFTDKPVVEYI